MAGEQPRRRLADLRAGSSRKMSPGWRISPSCQNAVMCFSPSPSMSKQSRDTKCRSRSTACAAQISPPVQRRATWPGSRTARLPQIGQWSGNT